MFTLFLLKKVVDKLKTFIQEHALLTEEDHVAIAVSGGKDSMAAVYLFNELGRPFSVIHCNFQLRGQESDDDEKFVYESCTALNNCTLVLSKRFDTTNYAFEKGLSIQEAARALRYQFFDEANDQKVFTKLVTAHHADDNVETFFINAYRVSGLKGLSGIPTSRAYIIRPLIEFSSYEIARYIESRDISFREDRSNSSDAYLRNRVRHHITPVLAEHFPNFNERLGKTMNHLSSTQELFSHFISKEKTTLLIEKNKGYVIEIERLKTYPQPGVFLYFLLDGFGFTQAQCRQIMDSERTGAQIFSNQYSLLKDRKTLIIQSISTTVLDIQIPGPGIYETPVGTLEISNEPRSSQSTDPYTEFVSSEALPFPLSFRFWLEGDKIQPFGMKGKKLLSDFFIDNKIDRDTKNKLPLLALEKEIFWIPGLRISEKLRLSDSMAPCFKLKFNPK